MPISSPRLALATVVCCVIASCASQHAATESSPPITVSATTIPASTATTAGATTIPATTIPATTIPATTIPTTTTTAPAQPATAVLQPEVRAVGTVTHGTLNVGGTERTYRLYVPSALPDGPVPLFIGLHGGTGWGDQFARTDHSEGLAESNGFIVVHPDGVQQSAAGRGGVWNGGSCCGVAARTGVDDVTFIAALIDSLEGQYAIDARRVYAFGHSNGAIMSYRLACELSDRIVGIGMYAGTLGLASCSPSQPVSIIEIHGAADLNIPLAGGAGSESIAGVDFAPPHDSFDVLAAADDCPAGSTATSGDITAELRSPCASASAAEFVTIATANHAWPDGTPAVTPAVGAGYVGYDATAEIVGFLLSHPRP